MSDHKNNQNTVLDNIEDTVVHKDSITQETLYNKPKEDHKYVVLMETSGEECESWYYCIRYNGNEKNLEHLQKQLKSVDWYILDDLSTFELDLEHFISEQTAKELTKLELNHHSFHRKFDGTLDTIELNLRHKDKNEKKMVKIFDILGYGQIEHYIDDEDIDEEDLTDNQDSSSSEQNESQNYKSDHEDSEKNNKGLPASLRKSKLPRFAKTKHNKNK